MKTSHYVLAPIAALLLLLLLLPGRPLSAADCNQNERSDASDIAEGTSLDCNRNQVPDECDIRVVTQTLGLGPTVFEGIDPQSLLFAELNGDGLLDALGVPLGSGAVAVRLRSDDFLANTFADEVRTYPAGPTPRAPVTADFDGDGLPDLAVTNLEAGTVSVLRGGPGGAFEAPRPLAVGAGPGALVAIDLGRGHGPDLASLNQASRDISVLWNDDAGRFALESRHAIPAAEVSELAGALGAADLDGDGDIDLLAAARGDAPAALFSNLGDARFAAGILIAIRGESLALADLDGDGDIDIASSAPDLARTYRNDGGGAFTLAAEFFSGKSPGGITAVAGRDFGVWDLVTSGDRLGVLVNGGEGDFTPWRLTDLFASTREIGPFASVVAARSLFRDKRRLLAALGTSTANEVAVVSVITVLGSMSKDCNRNGAPDECDVASGSSLDCNVDGWPDECEGDCNRNGAPDDCDIARGTSPDCNLDRVPDECDTGPGIKDADGDGVIDHCDPDNPFEASFRGPLRVKAEAGLVTADFLVQLSSRLPDGVTDGPQGWSLGVRAEGCDILSASVDNTAAGPGGVFRDGFLSTRFGLEKFTREPCVASSVVLSFLEPVTLDPRESPHDLLKLRVASRPLSDESRCSGGVLRFSNLCSPSQPVTTIVTWRRENRLPLLTSSSFELCLPDFRRGDADASVDVNITDAVRILNFLFVGGVDLSCMDAADATDDGSLDITDPIRILSSLFLSDLGLPPPGADICGPDPTPDALDCAAYESC